MNGRARGDSGLGRSEVRVLDGLAVEGPEDK